MKNVIWVRITKSLCAVFLIFGICLFAYPKTAFAAEISTETPQTEQNQDPDSKKPYRYLLEIEYGMLSFYYDWGVWDPDTCTYVAGNTSTDPAASTEKNQPGWYGFDGIANKISFLNYGTDGDATIFVRFDYHARGDDEITFPNIVQPEVTYYRDAEFQSKYQNYTNLNGTAFILEVPVQYSSETSEPIPTDVYVSFENAPYYLDENNQPTENMYHAEISSSIGFLQVTVGLNKDSLIPKS